MGRPLKICATVAVTVCSVSFGAGAGSDQTGASANFGKWWVRSKQSRTSSQDFESKTGPESTVDLSLISPPPSAGTSASDSDTSISRFGFNFAEHKTDHYHVLLRQQGVPAEVVAQTGDLLERAYHEFFSDLKSAGFQLDPVNERMSWLVFDNEDQYHDFARVSDGMNSSSLESYYAARTNQVVLMQASGASSWRYEKSYYGRDDSTASRAISGMDQPAQVPEVGGGGGLLDVRRAVHEAAHQLAFNTGLQRRGVMYPLWVSEGLATNFECDSASSIGMAGENAPRQRQLLRAHAGGRLMDLESFVTMVNVQAGGPSSANDQYAQSWGLFNFLFKTRRSDLKKYLTGLAQLEAGTRDDETMRQEFTSAFGSIDRLERAWNKYLGSLR